MSTRSPRPGRLSRQARHGRPAAPVRIVHLGLGNFFRAHQAWYTEHAEDAASWGIAAFTGRSPRMADLLNAQDGLYTLITQGPDGSAFEVISTISAVHAATDHGAWLDYWGDPHVAIVTLTVTEAGYLRTSDGHLETSRPEVQADVAALRDSPTAPVTTAPGRIVAGMLARRAQDAGALTIVPCDNLPDNGRALQAVIEELVEAVDPSLSLWAEDNIVFATTMVDRITPATTDAHVAAVLAATWYLDDAPVPTEPFSEWVIQGLFPKGRPLWEKAGARIVEDVSPFEQRKLWLLNGAHSLLAYAGSIRGHETVADAVADPAARAWVHEWWDEASAHLTLPAAKVAAYRQALLERFENPSIRHGLAQIAADGSQKLRVRIVPVLRAERAAGRLPTGAVRVVAAWVDHLRGAGAPVKDAAQAEVARLAEGTLEESVGQVVAFLAPDLADDVVLRDAVAAHAEELLAQVHPVR